MKIGLLTYNHPHLKTQDVVYRLSLTGSDITLFAYPWVDKENFKPLFPHRPSWCYPFNAFELSNIFHTDYVKIGNYKQLDDYDIDLFLICGAGIIDYIPKTPILNAHPGYIPIVRGLDALKWAIFHKTKIGITLHQITEQVDSSAKIIKREEFYPYPGEMFYHFAMRFYQREIEILVDSINWDGGYLKTEDIYDECFDLPFRRMPHNYEILMIKRFGDV